MHINFFFFTLGSADYAAPIYHMTFQRHFMMIMVTMEPEKANFPLRSH